MHVRLHLAPSWHPFGSILVALGSIYHLVTILATFGRISGTFWNPDLFFVSRPITLQAIIKNRTPLCGRRESRSEHNTQNLGVEVVSPRKT